MIRHALTRSLPFLALFVVPALAGCKFETTVVGDDDAGDVLDSGHAKGEDAGCTPVVCNEPMVGPGCTLGSGSCVDGKYVCPPVVCPSDAGAALDAGSVDGGCDIAPPCAPVALPSGCTWSQVTCNPATKTFSCPEPVCPDGGVAGAACKAAGGTCTGTGAATCANQAPEADQDCNPDRNPGGSFCCLDAATDAGTCVDISVSSYDVSCTQTSDCISIYAGQLCDGDCDCPNATVNASGQSQYDQAISGLQLGLCGCPDFPPPECVSGKCVLMGSAADAGTAFACGTTGFTCDSATQYCHITEGGPISPDGSTPVGAACDTIPSQCVAPPGEFIDECSCLEKAANAQQCTVTTDGGYTVTLEVP
jgi:hypothetical protein